MQPLFSLEQQLADLQNRARNGSGGVDLRAQTQAIMNQLNAQRQTAAVDGASAERASGQARVEEARKKMYGLAEGRLGELKSDPIDAQVIQELQNRISGKTNPYDQTTRDALLGQQSEMAAQVESNDLAKLRSGGGSASDPSYQASLNEATARRQATMQRASMDINTKANLANYAAQTSAVGGLGSFNAGRNAGITAQSNLLGGLYEKETAVKETPAALPTYELPNFGTWQQWLQGQAQPAAAPAAPAAATGRMPGQGNPIALQPGYVQAGYQAPTAAQVNAPANAPSNFTTQFVQGAQANQPVPQQKLAPQYAKMVPPNEQRYF